MSDQPLFDALCAYRAAGRSRFHMPGHGGRAEALAPLNDVLAFDATEIPGLDCLYEADGPIRRSEETMSGNYGCPVLYSAGGATLVIQTMLYLALNGRKKLLCGRNAHKSALNTIALLGVEPVWLFGDGSAGEGLFGRITPESVEEALRLHGDAGAVYLTSPDYYGVVSDIRGISRVCRSHGVPLLVDAAHGAHFRFLPEDMHPIALGADMAACSLHKTMPALTGSALLCCRRAEDERAAKNVMALFGSTSPSYLIMASMDLCGGWMKRCARDAFSKLLPRVSALKRLALEKGLLIPAGRCDPTRLAFGTAPLGLSGTRAAEIFRECGAEPEYADRGWLVLIPTPFHTEEDFFRVEQALSALPRSDESFTWEAVPYAEEAVPYAEAFRLPSEVVETEAAAGRIAAEGVCTCPPGVPVVVYGERISESMARFLRNYGIRRVKVLK